MLSCGAVSSDVSDPRLTVVENVLQVLDAPAEGKVRKMLVRLYWNFSYFSYFSVTKVLNTGANKLRF